MGTSTADRANWEIVLLRRRPGSRRARVAGRLRLRARDARAARRDAEGVLAARSGDGGSWTLGVLRPLTPGASGTQPYRVVCSIWDPAGGEFVRRDVHELLIWAEDATSARRLAQTDIQALPGYRPAWRIREVSRADRPRAPARADGTRPPRAAPDRLTLGPARRRVAERREGPPAAGGGERWL